MNETEKEDKIEKQDEIEKEVQNPSEEVADIKEVLNEDEKDVPSVETKTEEAGGPDNIPSESKTMKKSIPLLREEKVVLIDDNFKQSFQTRGKSLSNISNDPKSSFLKYRGKSILSHPSAKPFRYMLNKDKYENAISSCFSILSSFSVSLLLGLLLSLVLRFLRNSLNLARIFGRIGRFLLV